MHVRPTHFPAVHIALSQSAARAHVEPTGQAGQLPPQSMALSSPLRMRSVQLGPATSGG